MDPIKQPRESEAAAGSPAAQEALLRQAVDTSPLATVFTRGDDHAVHFANPALCRLLGTSLAELQGRPLAAAFPEARIFGKLLDRVRHRGVSDFFSDLTHSTRDGSVLHCVAVVWPLPAEPPQPGGLIVHLLDTTEQALAQLWEAQVVAEVKQANEALLLAGIREQELAEQATALYEQAKRATQAREELLAVVSHDLRTPLGAMLMSIAVLIQGGGSAGSGLGRKQLEILKRSAQRMSRLVQDLLDTASIEAGRLSVTPRRLELAPLLAEAAESIQPLLAGRSMQLISHVPAGLPLIWADAARLQQVLANLLGNAIKFTPNGGTITLRAESLGDRVQISIRDTGPGIAPADLPHLFERFWQAGATRQLGTGLGLFIVRGIVEAHHGRLWVKSEVGTGSTFFFTVPSG